MSLYLNSKKLSFALTVCSAILGVLPSVTTAHTGAPTVTSGSQSASSVPFASQLDPDMLHVLQIYRGVAGTPIYNLSQTSARQQFSAEDAAKALARATGGQNSAEPVDFVQDGLVIPGPAGPIPVRIYKPQGSGPFPVIVYFHGGGFVIATIDTYDASPRALTNLTGAIVVSVEYRKAPENPFPAAVDDAYASYEWVLANAKSFGGDSSRVAVAGESAGGALATDVCILARNNGIQHPVHQLLVYPYVTTSLNFPSIGDYANAVPLGEAGLAYFGKLYLRSAPDANNPLAEPIAAQLGGLPPATIIAAEIDPLQSEGRTYADRLKAAGNDVDYTLYTGVTHEFFGMGAVVAKAQQAEQHAASRLKQSFGDQ